ncbi:type II secretion system protein [bacterium]|nr:type II secretion system protein [bacterium]
MKKILAFTLAETLIVMGIIGVVAALTLPNLNSSTGDKEKVAKLQKIYSNLSDAVGRTQAVYGPRTGWTNKSFADRMEDFLKISKKCTGPRTDNCFTKTEKCLSGTDCKT